MTVVNPKSISGINSITTGSGSDDILTIHTNNGTERLRVDSTGTTKIVTGIVTTLTATTGIVTTLTANTVTSLGDVSIADKIVHTGDTNTAIRFSGADTIKLETSGTERFQVDSSGNIYVGGVGGSATAGTLFFNDTSANASKIAQSNGNSALTFHTGSSQPERVRIDSSGRLLIGTTTEGSAGADELTINTASGHGGMTIRTANDSNGNIWFSDGTSGAAEYAGWLQYSHASNNLNIGVNSAEKIRIHTDGTTSFTSGIGLGNALTYAASNTLDDYEEGTFAAEIVQGLGSLTQTFDNSATYTKIGNLVHVQALIQFSGVSNGTTVFLKLPFTHVTDTSLGGGLISFTNVAGLDSQSTLSLIGVSGQSYCQVKNKSGNPSMSGTNTNKAIYYHFTYQAA